MNKLVIVIPENLNGRLMVSAQYIPPSLCNVELIEKEFRWIKAFNERFVPIENENGMFLRRLCEDVFGSFMYLRVPKGLKGRVEVEMYYRHFNGDFEEKYKDVFRIVGKNTNVKLFIDADAKVFELDSEIS